MPTPYQYSTAPNPYALSIADILARRGDVEAQRATAIANAQAQAAQTSGQAWSRALDNVGQTIGAIPQQIAQQKREAIQQQTAQLGLDAVKRNQLSLGNANRIVSSLLQPDGTIDIGKATQMMSAENVNPDDQANALKHVDEMHKIAEGYKQDRINATADMAHSTIGMIDAGMDPWLAVATGAGIAKSSGIATDQDLGPLMAHLIQTPDASAIKNTLIGVRGLSEKYKAANAPVKLGKDEQLRDPSNLSHVLADNSDPDEGAYTINGQRFKKDGTPIGAPVPAEIKAGTPEDFVSRARRMAVQQNGGQPLSDQQQAAIDAKALEDYRKVNTDPEMRNARMALDAATLAARDPNGQVNQEKLENSYRTALMRPLSTRSGGLGMEDQKVNQAIHLMALLDQGKDKNGNYNIPAVQLNELALGLAKLVSPGGTVGEGMANDLNQRTAKGDVAGVLTYLTGQPVTGNTQAVIKMFRDSIERQGRVAEGNRQTYLDAIKAMAPTDLAEGRRAQIEQALNLNHLGGAPAAVAAPVPANVATALKGAGPGKHTLSDGSIWMIDANGNVSQGSR